MPGNQSVSPWKAQHTRQDFREEMYLNINISLGDDESSSTHAGVYYSKISVDTTAGFFELPNYMNGGIAGPLLEDDPSNYCGLDCQLQAGLDTGIYNHKTTSRATPNRTVEVAGNATLNFPKTSNKGTLLTTAEALFGLGSFLDTLQSSIAYAASMDESIFGNSCIEIVPFLPLVGGSALNELGNCQRYWSTKSEPKQIALYYLSIFIPDGFSDNYNEILQNAFTSAAFLANDVWMTDHFGTLGITYDLGADTEIPVISRPGLVLISILLGLDFVFLLALALYSAWTPRWTSQLDSFAMMRLGAAMGDRLPMLVTRNVDGVKALDETPGYIGDITGGDGWVGELGIGHNTQLQRDRMYRCYQHDDEVLHPVPKV